MTTEVPTTLLKITHHDAAHVANLYPYAAFGSNLSLLQMAERCPQVEIMTPGKLIGFRLAFARYATIIPDEGSTTPVGIYRLSPSDVAALDKREGLGRSYDRYLVTPMCADGVARRCFTYIKRDARIEKPSDSYYLKLVEGYRNWGFEDRKLRHARKRAEVEGVAQTKSRAASTRFTTQWSAPSQRELPLDSREYTAKKFRSARRQDIELGTRDHIVYWRVRGERQWYIDTTAPETPFGTVTGIFADRLPGAQAFTIKDNKKGESNGPPH